MTGARVVGIDVNEQSVEKAKSHAKEAGLNIDFRVLDATNMNFENEFDLILCSNTTSFIENKKAALACYKKALKTFGILAAIPIYYVRKPPVKMLDALSNELKVTIKAFTRNYWLSLFEDDDLERCYEKSLSFKHCTPDEIHSYITKYYLSKKLLKRFDASIKKDLFEKYLKQYLLFNKNLSFTNASVMLFRKVPSGYEKELFKPVFGD